MAQILEEILREFSDAINDLMSNVYVFEPLLVLSQRAYLGTEDWKHQV